MEPGFWIAPLAGGALIGLAAAAMMWLHGRIAGISGIFGGLVKPTAGDFAWRGAFVGGLVAGGLVMLLVMPAAFENTTDVGLPLVALDGLLVGFGTRLGSGCTSGHGVCGISRFSPRSIVATLTFIATGAGAVLVVRALGGA